MKTKSPFVTLSSLGRMPLVVGSIGIKKIIRVSTARLHKWFLVLPAVGNADCRCLLVRKQQRGNGHFYKVTEIDAVVLSSETERLAAREAAQ
jgi:hypothetical protein